MLSGAEHLAKRFDESFYKSPDYSKEKAIYHTDITDGLAATAALRQESAFFRDVILKSSNDIRRIYTDEDALVPLLKSFVTKFEGPGKSLEKLVAKIGGVVRARISADTVVPAKKKAFEDLCAMLVPT